MKEANKKQGGGRSDNDVAVTQCAIDGDWCCGADLTPEICCNKENRVFISPTIGVVTTKTSPISTYLSTSKSASSTTQGPSSVSSPTPQSAATTSDPKAEKKTGLGAGVKVGAGVGVPVIVGIIIVFFIFRRKKQDKHQYTPKKSGFKAACPSELENTQMIYEAPMISRSNQEYRKPELYGTRSTNPNNNLTYYQGPKLSRSKAASSMCEAP